LSPPYLIGADDISSVLAERQKLLSGHSSDTYTPIATTSDADILVASSVSPSEGSAGPINGRRRGSDVEVVGTPPVQSDGRTSVAISNE
jgi:hypothetical protein